MTNLSSTEISMDIDPYTGEILNVDQSPLDVETNDDAQSNDGKSVSDGDGETNDD